MPNPIVLIHGYSDSGKSFQRWREALGWQGEEMVDVHTCNYETLTNEVTITDIAEGFDRALRIQAGLDEDQEFDAIVHSTGMLVIRAWLASYAHRRQRLKRLIGLAPASFGSPLAHKGRSWAGAIFKGNRKLGPDFMEAGDGVLDGLELGSRYTWDLAHRDLLAQHTSYGPDADTPYVFIFCGNRGYRGVASIANDPGTDGTVRWAAAPLNTRKVTLDLTVKPGEPDGKPRFVVAPWSNVDIPLTPVDDADHGSILRDPPETLVELVRAALRVSSREEFDAWQRRAAEAARPALERMDRWQQFVVRAVDERGDPIPDYNIQLHTRSGGSEEHVEEFSTDVHAYGADPSFRCFHVNLTRLDPERLPNLWMRVIASSGSQLVGYHGYGSDKFNDDRTRVRRNGVWDAEVELTPMLRDHEVRLFVPYTTTLIELRLNREPLPLVGKTRLTFFEVS